MKPLLCLLLGVVSAFPAGTFNGTTQYLNLNSSPAGTYSLTIACWFNTTSITVGEDLMVLKENAVGDNFGGIGLAGTTGGDPIQGFQSEGAGVGSVTFNTTAGYTANNWHHACLVLANSTNRTIFINGGNSTNNTATRLIFPSWDRVYIGAFATSPSFVGRIAEVAIWNVSLTTPEVVSLSKGFKPSKVRPQSLVYYSRLIRNFQDIRNAVAIVNNNSVGVGDHPPVR